MKTYRHTLIAAVAAFAGFASTASAQIYGHKTQNATDYPSADINVSYEDSPSQNIFGIWDSYGINTVSVNVSVKNTGTAPTVAGFYRSPSASTNYTTNLSGVISVENSSEVDTYGYFSTISFLSETINFIGNAGISVRNTADPALALAISCYNPIIVGDGNKHTIKGNVQAYKFEVGSGNFVFDNFDSTTSLSASILVLGNGATAADTRVDFVKSVSFDATNVQINSILTFHAESVSDYTNMIVGYSGQAFSISQGAQFIMELDDSFTAIVGDQMLLLDGSANITSTFFSKDNVSLVFADGTIVDADAFEVSSNGVIKFVQNVVIPEPSKTAALLGLLALGLAAWRKRN